MLWTPCKDVKPRYESKPRIIQGHPIGDSVLGCWLMNEGAGLTAFDLLGKKPAYLAGNGLISSQGLQLDGTGDYASLLDKSLNMANGFTVILKLTTSSFTSKSRYLFSQWGNTGAGNSSWIVFIATDGKTVIGTHNGVAGSGVTLASTSAIVVNKDYWIGAVYTGGTTGANGLIYLNGVRNNAGTLNQIPQISTAYSPTIGNAPIGTGLDRAFVGTLYVIYLLNRGLSDNEVASLYYSPYQFIESARPTFFSFPEMSEDTPDPVTTTKLKPKFRRFPWG